MKDTVSTINHKEIKLWADERKGKPSMLTDPDPEASNLILRFYFRKNTNGEDLKEISWDKFFETFEKNKLSFVYKHDNYGGNNSNFHRFVFRDDIGEQN